MKGIPNSSTTFEADVTGRFGILPNFFRSARAAPELLEQLWGFAKAGYLANELRPEGRQYAGEGFAIVRYGKIRGDLQSSGACAYAGNEHFLLVSHQRVEFSFRNPRVRGDLERARGRIAALHERREGCIEDARAHRIITRRCRGHLFSLLTFGTA